MKCLIIGDGPSKELIDMETRYDVDSIICIHYPQHSYTDYVCSLDLTRFHQKEKIALEKNIPLIIASNAMPRNIKGILEKAIVVKPGKMRGNSGAFAIEWAISQGYTEIYTAGLDFYYPENTKKEYILKQALENINKFLTTKGGEAHIYKASSDSLLDLPVRMPYTIYLSRSMGETFSDVTSHSG